MHVALLVNPAARAGRSLPVAGDAAQRLRALGVQTTLLSGGSAAESTSLVRGALATGIDALVVAGGDGTVALAIQELAGTGIPLGIIPAGTGNDLAAAVGATDLDSAIDAIAAAHTKTIDLARATRADGTSRLYGTVLASGFDSRVNDRANAMRWPTGHRRYDIAIFREFLALRTSRFMVDIDLADGTSMRYDEELLIATVGNARTYGGGIPICPDAVLDDGLVDVVLVRPVTRARLARLLPHLYRGTHTAAPEVLAHRAHRVRITAHGVNGYADGDLMGALPLKVSPVPAALTVFARD